MLGLGQICLVETTTTTTTTTTYQEVVNQQYNNQVMKQYTLVIVIHPIDILCQAKLTLVPIVTKQNRFNHTAFLSEKFCLIHVFFL